MAIKQTTLRIDEVILQQIDHFKDKTRAAFIEAAIKEKIERSEREEHVASLRSLVDADAMDISSWMPLQRKAMKLVD